jgi:hypothetical protein
MSFPQALSNRRLQPKFVTRPYWSIAVEPNVVVEWFNTTPSYSEGPGFKTRPEDRLSWLSFSVSSVPPGECQDSALKFGHDRFLPNPFHFIILLAPFHSTLYSLRYWKSVVK